MSSPKPSTSKRGGKRPSPESSKSAEPEAKQPKIKAVSGTRRRQDGHKALEFERLMIAYLILRLTFDDDVIDFTLRSEVAGYEHFEDLVLLIRRKCPEKPEKLEEEYAFQLKYAENKRNLSFSEHFRIKSQHSDYWDENKKLSKKDKKLNLIMFTNRNFIYKPDHQINILDENFSIKKRDNTNTVFNKIFSDKYYAFVGDKKATDDWSNLFLYTNQLNNEEMKDVMKKILQEKFECSDEFLEKSLVILYAFIKRWKNPETYFVETPLKKTEMKNVIAWCLLRPHIELWSFDGQSVSGNREIFRNAIKFQKTALSKSQFTKIKNIWVNINIDHNEVAKAVEKYQIICSVDAMKPWEQLDDKEKTKILWLMNECPLAVEVNSSINKVINLLCQEKNFVLLCGNPSEIQTMGNVFHFLSDLKYRDQIYDEIVRNFFCQLQGRPKITLKDLIGHDGAIGKIISTNELVEMLDKPLLIGENAEMKRYMKQSLSFAKIKLDATFFSKMSTAVIVISSVQNSRQLKVQFQSLHILRVKKFLSENEIDVNNQLVLVSKKICSAEDFNKICEKSQNKTCHHFKMSSDDNDKMYLECISSNKNASELRSFINNGSYTTPRKIFSKINLICDNPGTGKSTFLQSIQTYRLSTFWRILISPNIFFSYSDKEKADVESFKSHITNCVSEKYDFDDFQRKMLKQFIQEGRIYYCWDGLNGYSQQDLDMVKNLIRKLSEEPSIEIWITSRINEQQELEEYFNVIARKIKKFDEKKQKEYIEKLLESKNIPVDLIYNKIQSSPFQDILKNPLHTYLFIQFADKDGQLGNIFSAIDIYEHFVKEKINSCYEDATFMPCKNRLGEEILEDFTYHELDYYKKISLKNYFENSTENWNPVIDIRPKAKLWETKFLIGIANDIEFVHTSFREYFVALYLSENSNKLEDIKNFTTDPKYEHIRFFLDLIRSKNLPKHETVTIESGRLDLTWNWHMNYPLPKIEQTRYPENSRETQCIIIKLPEDPKPKNKNYIDALKRLLRTYNKQGLIAFLEKHNIFFRVESLFKLIEPAKSKDKDVFVQQNIYNILYNCIVFDIEDVIDHLIDDISIYFEDFKTKESKSMFYHVVVSNSIKILTKMTQCEKYQEMLRNNQDNLVFEACNKKYYDIAMLLIDNEVKFNITENGNSKLLLDAYHEKGDKIVRMLISKTEKITVEYLDFADNQGETLMHYGCINGEVEMVELLIERGANKYAVNREGLTPFHYACSAIPKF